MSDKNKNNTNIKNIVTAISAIGAAVASRSFISWCLLGSHKWGKGGKCVNCGKKLR